ncbi:MAG: membrane protein insertase YidC [Deltaproteobacteria bacterium]|nr:membrane protein insertase YidC [Deltaproteobacteria bacterium]
MSEQQRIFATVALCLGILLVWQFVFVKPEADKSAQETAGKPATAARPTSPEAAASSPAAVPTNAEAPTAAAPSLPAVPESRRAFSTPLFAGEVSNVPASLTALTLNDYKETAEGGAPKGPVSLVTDDKGGAPRQALVTFDLGKIAAPALAWSGGGNELVLAGTSGEGVRTEVQIKPRPDAYALDYTLKVTNGAAEPVPVSAGVTLMLKPTVKQKSGFLAPPADMMNGLCAHGGTVERRLAQKLAEDGPWSAEGPADWVGIDRQYFVVAAVPHDGLTARCSMSGSEVLTADGKDKDHDLQVAYGFAPEAVAPGATWERSLSVYLGPKRHDSLVKVAARLEDTIDYVIWGIPLGFLARPMVFLLNIFHGWTTSWGVAIMMLTLLVKALLFPVTFKSSLSMRKMQVLKPELDRIKKQFENDKQRQQLEQMKLFKDKGVNPLGGCLPMLLQMPVWLALYRTLWSAVDLYQQPFMWIQDLTAKEPFPFMAIALGALTYLQQKLTPTTMDSQQAKMMLYMMPAMMVVFMIALPSGLVLYILFNAILTIFQQLAINRTKVTL